MSFTLAEVGLGVGLGILMNARRVRPHGSVRNQNPSPNEKLVAYKTELNKLKKTGSPDMINKLKSMILALGGDVSSVDMSDPARTMAELEVQLQTLQAQAKPATVLSKFMVDLSPQSTGSRIRDYDLGNQYRGWLRPVPKE